MKKLLIIALLFVGCNEKSSTGYYELSYFDDVIFTIENKTGSTNWLKVEGTVTNIGTETIPNQFGIYCKYYSDSTLTHLCSSDNITLHFPFIQGETYNWTMRGSCNGLLVPDWVITDLVVYY